MLNTILGSFSTGAPPVAPSSYESIATVTVGSGGSSTITFTSIPATYEHLQIRGLFLPSASADYRIRFNSNTTAADYARHVLYGDGSSTAAAGVTSAGFVPLGYAPATTYPTVSIVDILDYRNTNKNTTVRTLYGNDFNGSGIVALASGVWLKTDAITQIDITASSGTFNQYSSFALYGIKGS